VFETLEQRTLLSLTVTAVPSDTQTALSWTSDPSAVSYNAYESTDLGETWTKINSSPITGTSFNATGLTNGSTYDFSVTTVDASDDESDPGDNDEEVVPEPPIVSVSGAPSVVEGATYTLTLNASQLSSPAEAGAIDHWTVDWGDGTTDDPDVQTISGSATSATHTYESNGSFDISATATDQVGTLAAPKLQVDASYGSSGTTLLSIYTSAQTATVQSDGKLLVAMNGANEFSPGGFSIVRLNADGSLDTSFDCSNDAAISTGGGDVTTISDIKELSSGKLIALATGDYGSDLIEYNSDGSTDTSFGTDGVVATASGVGSPNSLAIQSDGKIIEVGSAGIARYNADGSMDTSFGSSGVVTISGGAASAIELSGGKLLVLGSHLQRYNSDGTLDTTFASSGSAAVGSYGIYGGMALGSDGQIFVAALTSIYGFNSDGSANTSFGTSGVVSLSSGVTATSVAVEADGNILYAGGGATVGRLTSSGAADPTFGTSGLNSPLFNPYWATSVTQVIALANGKDLVIGDATHWSPDGTSFDSKAAVQQLLPSNAVIVTVPPQVTISGDTQVTQGSTYTLHLNSEFPSADSGFETIDSWTIDWGDGDTQTISGNPTTATHSYNAVASYNISASVSYDGSTTTANVLGVSSTTPDSTWTDSATEVGGTALQQDGKLVTVDSDGTNFIVKRYDASGLDPTFGTDGVVTTDVTEADTASVFIQNDGDILVVGSNGSGATMVRYLPDGTLDSSFGDDGISVISDGNMSDAGKFAELPDGQLILDARDNFGTDTFDVLSIDADGTVVGGLGGGYGDAFAPVSAPFVNADGSFIVLGSGDAGAFYQPYSSGGVAGTAVPLIDMTSSINDVAAQSDGKTIVEGTNVNGLLIERFNTDGTFDASFNFDGTLSDNPTGAGPIAIEPDDKIVVATTNGSGDIVISRFNSDGSRDALFGTDGQIVTDLAGAPDQVVIAPDGAITVSATGDGSVTVATYNDQVSGSVPVSVYQPLDLSSSTLIGSSSTFPDLPYAEPSSDPTLPSGMNAFSPPVNSDSPVSGAPVISASNVAATPDESIALTGANFTALSGDAAYADTQFVVYGQTSSENGTMTLAQIQDEATAGTTITINSSQPDNSMYFVWAVNANGVSAPVAINQTQAWWMGAPGESVDTSTSTTTIDSYSGDTMAIYGRNLSNGASTPESWVYLAPTGGGSGTWATVTSVNPYEVEFTLPTVSSATTYNVWVNNGLGGKYSWAEVTENGAAVVLSDGPTAPTWAGTSDASSSWIDVTSYFAADGGNSTGTADDTTAFQAALNALANGDTLYIPSGTYTLSGHLYMPTGVSFRILGDGESDSTVEFTDMPDSGVGGQPDFDITSVQNSTYHYSYDIQNVEMDNITFKSDETSSADSGYLLELDGTNVLLNDVQMIGNIDNPFEFSGDGFTVENSIIQGAPARLGGSQNVFIENDTFRNAYGTEETLDMDGGHNTAIVDNTFVDDNDSTSDDSGLGQGRLIRYNLDAGSVYNQYLAGNSTDLGSFDPDNHGEQILQEGELLLYDGTPTIDSSDTMTITTGSLPAAISAADAFDHAAVVVSNGTGIGQLRTITGITVSSTTSDYDGSSLVSNVYTVVATLDHPWAVTPDSSSTVFVGAIFSNSAVYDNTLADISGSRGAESSLEASTGVDLQGYNFVADGNTIDQLGTGFQLWTSGYGQPSYFDDFINNTVESVIPNDEREGNGTAFGLTVASDSADEVDTNFIGARVEDNIVDQAVTGIDLVGDGPDTLSIIENNSVEAQNGIVTGGDPDTLIRENTFTAPSDSPTTPEAVVFTGESPLLRDNSYVSYGTGDIYYDSPDTPFLAAPQDVLYGTVTAGGSTTLDLTLWNDGPASLSWYGTTSSSWLSLSSSTGTISGETSTTSPTLSVDASSLTTGTYLATVSILLANSTVPKVFAVWLTVT
jgi:uncharacterized delta-60 repeat protein